MNFLKRWLKRMVMVLIDLGVLWFISTQIFTRLDQRLPLFLALFLTYLISAFVVLPKVVNLSLLILRKGRIPRFTVAGDGLFVDPVNIILVGTKDQLKKAFKKIDWYGVDRLTFKSGLKIMFSYSLNKTYLKAPISNLYLFGRKQDICFQQQIGKCPRKRHHIRFWAANTDKIIDPMDIKYWRKKQKINKDEALTWIGSGSEDIGLTFKKLTYQPTHKVDPNVDKERNYILSSLRKNECIGKIKYYKAGAFNVGKYTSDGKIAVANLKI